MFLKFQKWHGCHNDFILTWQHDDKIIFDSIVRAAPKLCSRSGSSIGADGVLVMEISTRDQIIPNKLSIINSDGSIAATCGNGIRVAALSILKRFRELENTRDIPDAFPINLGEQEVECRFMGPRKIETGSLPLVAVNMGIPKLNKTLDYYDSVLPQILSILSANGLKVSADEIHLCNIGNNHVVVFTDEASQNLIRKIGPLLQDLEGLDGINVHIAKEKPLTDDDLSLSGTTLGESIEELYEVFVWERGAGETQACGSGACAVGVAAFAGGLIERSQWLAVDMPGGRLYIKHEEDDDPVTLAGPGQLAFTGEVEI